TIIISSISAADVTMLILPEMAPYRILLAEAFAFFIMVVLVAIGPRRAVPLFLLGGGAFTIFTLGALSLVGGTAAIFPEWAFLTEGIVTRLQASGVTEHVVRVTQDLSALSTVVVFQLFFRSMSSAMLGFSGYEVIPASGKHAARPKWKVINTALTLAAIFLIGTGIFQLFGASQWKIPATEGYSTLLIEYEIVAVQTMGDGVIEDNIIVTNADVLAAEALFEKEYASHALTEPAGSPIPAPDEFTDMSPEEIIAELANDIALSRTISESLAGTRGESFLVIAGTLLAIILLLAQGGGYIGGAAVAANAARLGRLPSFFSDDRIGISVIWAIAAMTIPIIKEVVVVESYYAFGFVSAFVITSTTVFFVRDSAMRERSIEPDSGEAKSLKFAGLRGMIASYFMMIVLVTQKTDALPVIIATGAVITAFQLIIANGGVKRIKKAMTAPLFSPGTDKVTYKMGVERAHDQARQRGIANAVIDMLADGSFAKFNVGPDRVQKLICYLYNINPQLFSTNGHHHEHTEEPSVELEATYQEAYRQNKKILRRVEDFSHFGIFMFIHNYSTNWIDEERKRGEAIVQKTMLDILFPLTDHDEIWDEFSAFKPQYQPEPVWQFSRRRYLWAKDQWPNLSGRVTTIWTLQDFDLISKDIDIHTVISVADGKQKMRVKVPTQSKEGGTWLSTTEAEGGLLDDDNGKEG
ncbi:MAG: hypothetical protein GWP17_01995, partial [Aquificales bacterium]|nr:hypothetical protein [Aquificales bacterium]